MNTSSYIFSNIYLVYCKDWVFHSSEICFCAWYEVRIYIDLFSRWQFNWLNITYLFSTCLNSHLYPIPNSHIPQFNKHILNSYSLPGTTLRSRDIDIAVDETDTRKSRKKNKTMWQCKITWWILTTNITGLNFPIVKQGLLVQVRKHKLNYIIAQ